MQRFLQFYEISNKEFHQHTQSSIHVPYISTFKPYLCIINLKQEVNMWLAVIISVCLAVEALSYISGGEFKLSKNEKGSEA